MTKTTKEDFEIFKKECEKWIDFFGLKDWDIYFSHDKFDESILATCDCGETENKKCVLSFNKEIKDDALDEMLTEFHIKKSAFHEVCHLLLANFQGMARYRYVTSSELTQEEHTIVTRLENSVFKKLNNESSV